MSRRGYGDRSQTTKRPQLMDIEIGYDAPFRKRMALQHRGGGMEEGGYREGAGRPSYRSDDAYDIEHSQPSRGHPTQNQPSFYDRPSFVLLMTVYNPKYPVNVDVINAICAADGRLVNRIMMFRKDGIQAMVEFDSVEMAVGAMKVLDGADIYSGCCTLRIEFAKPLRLGVVRNDSESCDYTNPHLGGRDVSPYKSTPLLPDPKFSSARSHESSVLRYDQREGGREDYNEQRISAARMGDTPRGRGMGPRGGFESRGGGARSGYGDGYGNDCDDEFNGYSRRERGREPPLISEGRYPPADRQERYGHSDRREERGRAEPSRGEGYRGSRGGRGDKYLGSSRAGFYEKKSNGSEMEGCVLMVYGCSEVKMNCQRLFNLLCVYGNVIKIKFLKTKENSVMVQMGDVRACERVIENLSGCSLFGQNLCLSFSKQAFIQDPVKINTLSDGTPSFVDFSDSRNNRYTSPESVLKNKIFPPSSALYFYNVPVGIKEDELSGVFEEADTKRPIKVKIFGSRNDKTSTGVVEWASKSDCVEALIAANHISISNPASKNPFVLKFSFTNPGRM